MGIFINSLSHSYDGNVKVLKEINCVIDEHKITTIFGPSGCGKTTLLNILAGIVNPTSGMVKIDNTDITTVPVQKRNVGYVFQDYALYPNMSVYDNISFPLQSKKISKTVIWEKVHQLAKTLHIEEHLSKKQPTGTLNHASRLFRTKITLITRLHVQLMI